MGVIHDFMIKQSGNIYMYHYKRLKWFVKQHQVHKTK